MIMLPSLNSRIGWLKERVLLTNIEYTKFEDAKVILVVAKKVFLHNSELIQFKQKSELNSMWIFNTLPLPTKKKKSILSAQLQIHPRCITTTQKKLPTRRDPHRVSSGFPLKVPAPPKGRKGEVKRISFLLSYRIGGRIPNEIIIIFLFRCFFCSNSKFERNCFLGNMCKYTK